MKRVCYVIANFGGPRNKSEITPFLTALLTDQDVIQTGLPSFLHGLIFKRVAKKRTNKVAADYELIGGRSPIYDDTESVAKKVEEVTGEKVLTFHRYLPETHGRFIEEITEMDVDEFRVFSMFPQFSYATTGSIARFFENHLPGGVLKKMFWISSYAAEEGFIDAYEKVVRQFIKEQKLKEKEVMFLHSCHGVPKKFVCGGDPYKRECELSFMALSARLKKGSHLLAYQSKFGPGEWLRPYTDELCDHPENWMGECKTCVFIPLAFTSDHIETLFEIENDYVAKMKELGFDARRCPALNLNNAWLDFVVKKCQEECSLVPNSALIRQKKSPYCSGKNISDCAHCGEFKR